ncbi:hypothetical protein GCM10022631_10780 [Deinococcus rubellus]
MLVHGIVIEGELVEGEEADVAKRAANCDDAVVLRNATFVNTPGASRLELIVIPRAALGAIGFIALPPPTDPSLLLAALEGVAEGAGSDN